MKQNPAPIAAIIFALLIGQVGDAAAKPPVHAKKKPAKASPRTSEIMPCKSSSINAKEDREIVIMKLTQRMDCLEGKVNYLSEQLSLQTKGAVRPFAEQGNSGGNDYVIKYPRDIP